MTLIRKKWRELTVRQKAEAIIDRMYDPYYPHDWLIDRGYVVMASASDGGGARLTYQKLNEFIKDHDCWIECEIEEDEASFEVAA